MPWLKSSTQKSVKMLADIIALCREQPHRLTVQQCKILVNHTSFFRLVPKFLRSTFPRHQDGFEDLEMLTQDSVNFWTPAQLTCYAQLLDQVLAPASSGIHPVDFPQRFHELVHRLAPIFSIPLAQ